MAPNIGDVGVRASVTVAIVRGVAVPASKTDNRTRVMRIAVHAIVRRSHSTGAPAALTTIQAAPGGFGCNGSRRNDRNQAKKVAEQRNHGS